MWIDEQNRGLRWAMSGGTNGVTVVLSLALSITVIDGWKRVALLAARRLRDNW